MRLYAILAILTTTPTAFAACTKHITQDGLAVSVECLSATPLSARKLLTEYWKANPKPVVMVVRAFQSDATRAQYHPIRISDIDQVRYFIGSARYAASHPSLSEAIWIGGAITTRERRDSVIRVKHEFVPIPKQLCPLPIPPSIRWAHVDISDLAPFYRREGVVDGVSLYIVSLADPSRSLARFAALTESIQSCLPAASVRLQARTDPFFVEASKYPLPNPF